MATKDHCSRAAPTADGITDQGIIDMNRNGNFYKGT